MEQPWGISGPEFLWLYGAGLVVALGWMIAVRARVRRPRQIEPTPPLELESVAYLAGGARRVIELAIARLIEAGAIRASRGGSLTAIQSPPGRLDPVATAVMSALGNRTRKVNTLIRSVRATHRISQLSDELAAHQLVLTPRAAARARRVAWLGLVLLLAVGVARFVNGAMKDLPVNYLVIELVVTVALLMLVARRPIRPRTVHGDRALASARNTISAGVGLVALFGLAMFPDQAVRSVLAPARASAGSSNSWSYAGGVYIASCGGSASSGGSSCGGSSGGGSSCGGGGGGGGGGCGGGGGG